MTDPVDLILTDLVPLIDPVDLILTDPVPLTDPVDLIDPADLDL